MSNHPFDKESARSYTDRPPRQVPGFDSLHRMAGMLLAEHAPADGQLLVLGAGGGLELKALAEGYPGWTFDGVDPSGPMLDIARQTVGRHAERMRLVEGYIDSAPSGPYDGALSLLTFHFIAREQRLPTLRQIFQRLTPGAAFVLAHISIPQSEPERSQWLARHIAYGDAGDMSAEQRAEAQRMMATRLTILAPEEEEALLRAAGFTGIALFYAGLSFKGWVAYRP